jgi:NAD(P)H-hydrate epimerase
MTLKHRQFLAADWLPKLKLPTKNSHKGDNGKLLIIGGSGLFHAASKWSLDIASKLVDMVFYASTPENETLVKAAKGEFWNGIVIGMDHLNTYLAETDVVVIGPGMERTAQTADLVNQLVSQFPTKKWVIDAGALQMIDPQLIPPTAILTPHLQELKLLNQKISRAEIKPELNPDEILAEISTKINCIVLYKGEIDLILDHQTLWQVTGGNPGMTKGGTGDVLAGLVGGLYCQQEALPACLIASYINKLAGDELAVKVGPFFNASDLVDQIPQTLWGAYLTSQSK